MKQASKASGAGNGAPYTVGLDIGFGVTKALMAGAPPVLFPSLYGAAREARFRPEELSQRYPGMQLSDDAGDWFLGDLALKHNAPGELVELRGRSVDSDVVRARLAKAALGCLLGSRAGRAGDVLQVRIATGLPVGHMRNAAALKAALMGRHRVQTDAADFIADVIEVAVMPQPYGTVYALQLTPDGAVNPCHTARRIGVIDVGTYTVDLACDDAGEFVDSLSDTQAGGVHIALERLSELIEARDNEKPDRARLEHVLRTGCDLAYGREVDMRADVQREMQPVINVALTLARRKWERGASLEAIFCTGGGAPLVFDDLQAEYEHAQLVPDSQLANARGYLAYGALTANGA